jgi:hypothetical protein
MSTVANLSLVLRQVCLGGTNKEIDAAFDFFDNFNYNTNIRFPDGKTPLMLAAEAKNIRAVLMLMRTTYEQPMKNIYAPSQEDCEIVPPLLEALLGKGEDKSIKDAIYRLKVLNSENITFDRLERQVYDARDRHFEYFAVSLDAYLRCGGNIDNIFYNTTTLLFHAVVCENFDKCLLLLKRGASPSGTLSYQYCIRDKNEEAGYDRNTFVNINDTYNRFQGKTVYEIALLKKAHEDRFDIKLANSYRLKYLRELDELLKILEPKPVTDVLA